MATEAAFKFPAGTIQKFGAGAAKAPGEVEVIGNRIGVVSGVKPIAIGEDYTLQTLGVFEVTILGTDTPSEGDILYWDATNNRLTTTASSHKSAGLAAASKGSGITKILCDINASVASATI